jgi:hypothetical protein
MNLLNHITNTVYVQFFVVWSSLTALIYYSCTERFLWFSTSGCSITRIFPISVVFKYGSVITYYSTIHNSLWRLLYTIAVNQGLRFPTDRLHCWKYISKSKAKLFKTRVWKGWVFENSGEQIFRDLHSWILKPEEEM